jgi:hypothetical protein
MVKTPGALLLCCGVLLFTGVADADGPPPSPEASPPAENPDDIEARQSFDRGLELLRAKQWTEAEQLFRDSLVRKPRQSTRYNLALVLFQQRRYLESLTLLEELFATADAARDAQFREFARALLPHVQANISTVHLFIEPAGATLRIDGEPHVASGGRRAIRLNPGAHRLELDAPGFQRQSLELTTEPGTEQPRTIVLTRARQTAPVSGSPASPPPTRDQAAPSRQSTVGPWLTIGAGTALVVSGLIVGVAAIQADDDFVEQCPTLTDCDRRLIGLRDKAARLGRISDVLLVSGGAVVIGGITWRVLTPTSASSTSSGSVPGAISITAHGSF